MLFYNISFALYVVQVFIVLARLYHIKYIEYFVHIESKDTKFYGISTYFTI
jgi:hypothetical protein